MVAFNGNGDGYNPLLLVIATCSAVGVCLGNGDGNMVMAMFNIQPYMVALPFLRSDYLPLHFVVSFSVLKLNKKYCFSFCLIYLSAILLSV